VTYYTVGERHLRPGTFAAYRDAARRIIAYWGDSGEQAYTICVADDEPERVLTIGSWPSQERFEIAFARVPDEIREAPGESVLEGHGDFRWYKSLREIVWIGPRTSLVVVHRFFCNAAEATSVHNWMHRLQDRAVNVPGVTAMRLLAATDAPHEFLILTEYQHQDARGDVESLFAQSPPPVPLNDSHHFSGRVGFGWDRLEATSAVAPQSAGAIESP
jgi:hypothetical protein